MDEASPLPAFRAPGAIEALFNRAFGFVVGLGFGPAYVYLLQVRGRKSGRIYSTPVNLLTVEGRQVLVAPRGRTQWVRNAESVGEITLKRGGTRLAFRVKPVASVEKPKILKAYLDSYAGVVQRYFPVPAGSPAEAFAEIVDNYPVFALLPN